MTSGPGTLRRRLKRLIKSRADAVAGRLAVLLLKTVRLTDPDRMADLVAYLMRAIGPWLGEHRIGRANLAAAFPEKSEAEIEGILRGVWDNLGRIAAEFAHLDRLWDHDEEAPERPARVEFSPKTKLAFDTMRDDRKPALIFAAHLANWEMPALAAAAHRLDSAVLYRRLNIGAVADAVVKLRAGGMGTLIASGPDAPFKINAILERGGHVAMLVDQHYERGVDVTFFGRRCKANPMLARLARHYDCAIHGSRTVRLPGHRFRVDLTEAIETPRDAGGRIDVAGTMQAVTSVIEGWVREHPEQWLWLHRRWR
jgi:Kdo2-lipid IVA lauroyltransferase/acyltransferase